MCFWNWDSRQPINQMYGSKSIIFASAFFCFLLFVDVRPGMAMESKSEHTSCPEESSAHPRTQDSQETVAGRHVLSHKTPTLFQQII